MVKRYKKVKQETKIREIKPVKEKGKEAEVVVAEEPLRGPGGGKKKVNKGSSKPVSRALDPKSAEKQKLTFVERIMTTLHLGSFMSLLAITSIAYRQLPEQIPIRFNRLGEVIGYGGHGRIWLLCVVGAICYLALMTISYAPQVLRYPCPVTKKTAPYLFHYGRLFSNYLGIVIQAQFITINYYMWQVGVGNLEKSNQMLTNFYLILIVIGLSIYYFSSRKIKKKLENGEL